jgi:hypothetical protein
MKTRTKNCKNCKEEFTPYTTLQKYCTKSECIGVFVAETKAKKWAKDKREKKAELMTVTDWVKIAQTAFNAFIRERDKDKVMYKLWQKYRKRRTLVTTRTLIIIGRLGLMSITYTFNA